MPRLSGGVEPPALQLDAGAFEFDGVDRTVRLSVHRMSLRVQQRIRRPRRRHAGAGADREQQQDDDRWTTIHGRTEPLNRAATFPKSSGPRGGCGRDGAGVRTGRRPPRPPPSPEESDRSRRARGRGFPDVARPVVARPERADERGHQEAGAEHQQRSPDARVLPQYGRDDPELAENQQDRNDRPTPPTAACRSRTADSSMRCSRAAGNPSPRSPASARRRTARAFVSDDASACPPSI